ncbi:putative surf4 family protein [Botrytis fragariae]|uniref:Putative surf4 family protein n=1 Tax=Botrytis fragariae TaxID=1964551 RepID=A0A8H6EDZ4_9HELO|nr:putative surf4 family protein [Botrytis fragariae]KAF5868410.1 putative surf4 family protein [Botrytis fragariae]
MEAFMKDHSDTIKKYIPLMGRFLIIVTFLEDAFTIVTEWKNQLIFLNQYRKIYYGVANLILFTNVVLMISCSSLVLARKHIELAVGGLIFVVVTQALCYGMISDFGYFLRNLSVLGGLLIMLCASWARKRPVMAGLPGIEQKDNKMYVQLAGRVLIVLTFLAFFSSLELNLLSVIVFVVGFGVCVMVAVGYKAKISGIVLVSMLSVLNFLINDFWNLHQTHPRKAFAKYDFLQTLSIAGGLILLVNNGPGAYSIDEKAKEL